MEQLNYILLFKIQHLYWFTFFRWMFILALSAWRLFLRPQTILSHRFYPVLEVICHSTLALLFFPFLKWESFSSGSLFQASQEKRKQKGVILLKIEELFIFSLATVCPRFLLFYDWINLCRSTVTCVRYRCGTHLLIHTIKYTCNRSTHNITYVLKSN